MPTALVVEDSEDSRDLLMEVVGSEGFAAHGVGSLAAARASLAESAPDLLLLDVKLPDGPGTALLAEGGGFDGDVIVVTGHASEESALEALRSGATDYLVKPIDVQRLRTVLRHLERRQRLEREVGKLRTELRSLGHFGGLVGISEAMQRAYDRLGRVAPTDASVLITGETGTGKELAARTLHDLGPRREGPFVAVNCGAIPASLMESELFGHEKGAFSGADRRHAGYFERASGGTIFLDEITEMPLELQVKLLRVLELGRLTRVGGEAEIEIDVRTVAATNRSPAEAVEKGRLREDLLYRLRVLQVDLPPLRERPGDVSLLAAHFMSEIDREEGSTKVLSDAAIRVLSTYSWPGNVRELKNVVYSAHVLADETIDPEHLPEELRAGPGPATQSGNVPVFVGMTVAEAERALLRATLASVEGNRKQAADILGVSLKTLYNRLREYREAGEPLEEE